jgi:hypothetical protein
VVSSIGTPSVYADQMSRLREFACLPAEDPRRRVLREQLPTINTGRTRSQAKIIHLIVADSGQSVVSTRTRSA